MSSQVPEVQVNTDDGLTTSELTATLEQEVTNDVRFHPVLSITKACESPEVHYYSPEVVRIIDEMRHWNDDKELKHPKRSSWKTVPFRLGDEAVDVVHKVAEVVERVEGHIEDDVHLVLKRHSQAFHFDPEIEQVIDEDGFKNWGETVRFRAGYTLIVRTIAAVCKIVKWAASEGRKVRVAGFRHSWSDVFGANGDVIIMFLPFESLVELPYKDPPPSFKTELSGITEVETVGGQHAPDGHAFCKIMAGTTNDQFRKWCFRHKKYCLPLNVIMTEVTFGGTNAPICHGSGLHTTTLSDLVVEVQYVDATGNVRIVNDPVELQAASGAFGLLGVVVSLTLQLDEMAVVNMMPTRVPLPLAIPPPKDYDLPKEVQDMIEKKGITPEQIEAAQREFETRCERDWYLEWFWFPYQQDAWVNTWSKTPISNPDINLKAYPGEEGSEAQEIDETLAQALIYYQPFNLLPGRVQAYAFGAASMVALPNIKDNADAIKTFQSEAEHFRRGIQNFRCWDTEWEIPVGRSEGKPNYATIQRAWWDGISAIYARPDAPVRVALEMRLTGGSNVLLAPQRGNEVTASIEALTTLITPEEDWASFMQQIADRWTSYDERDEQGSLMRPRPHWAKQWKGLHIDGKPIETYLKEDAYKDAFAQFRDVYEQIVTNNGSTVEETLDVFGNELMRRLIWE